MQVLTPADAAVAGGGGGGGGDGGTGGGDVLAFGSKFGTAEVFWGRGGDGGGDSGLGQLMLEVRWLPAGGLAAALLPLPFLAMSTWMAAIEPYSPVGRLRGGSDGAAAGKSKRCATYVLGYRSVVVLAGGVAYIGRAQGATVHRSPSHSVSLTAASSVAAWEAVALASPIEQICLGVASTRCSATLDVLLCRAKCGSVVVIALPSDNSAPCSVAGNGVELQAAVDACGGKVELVGEAWLWAQEMRRSSVVE